MSKVQREDAPAPALRGFTKWGGVQGKEQITVLCAKYWGGPRWGSREGEGVARMQWEIYEGTLPW